MYLNIVASRSSQTVGSDVLLPITIFPSSVSNNYITSYEYYPPHRNHVASLPCEIEVLRIHTVCTGERGGGR